MIQLSFFIQEFLIFNEKVIQEEKSNRFKKFFRII
jgi:hypothetical protein